MKVYLAGPYCARPVLKDLVRLMESSGHHQSTARWLNATHDIVAGTEGAALDLSDDYAVTHALEDFEDILQADVLIVFTGKYLADVQSVRGELHSGGRHVETGYAIGAGKHVIVVGEPENIFHRGSCLVSPRFSDTLAHLDAMQARRDRRRGAVRTASLSTAPTAP